jgi:hypothetical protein
LVREELGAAIGEAITGSNRIGDLMGKIAEMGYFPLLALGGTLNLIKRDDAKSSTEVRESQSLVQDGKVVSGAFTDGDREWMRTCKIKID